MERPFNEDQVIPDLDTWTLYTNTGTWSSIIGRSLIAPYRFKNCDNLQIPYISYQVRRDSPVPGEGMSATVYPAEVDSH